MGLAVTLTTIICIVAADTGAYFIGRALGRTKLTDISPKKTAEGAAGGLACAAGAALALQSVLGWPAGGAAAAVGYGALIFAASIFGDLIESIIKREAGMKVGGGGCRSWARAPGKGGSSLGARARGSGS
jgi:phosphatidate cytidylyltransferase